MRDFMNKFSSLSTSILLACLTSSMSTSAMAQISDKEVARLNSLSSVNTDSKSDELKDGLDLNQLTPLERSGEQSVFQGRVNNIDVSINLNSQSSGNEDNSQLNNEFVIADNQQDASAQPNQEATSLSLKGSQAAELAAQILTDPTLSNKDGFEVDSDKHEIKMQKSTHVISLSDAKEDLVSISLEHPTKLNESFIQAGDTSVYTYSNATGSFIITLKMTPLAKDLKLTFDEFKKDITHRFSDKANLLYGEYETIKEVNNEAQGKLEFALKGFLKKPADGFLPDMLNYFYEREIVQQNLRTSISCEFRGTQAQGSQTKMLYNNLGPLCERVINSYQSSLNS